MLLPLLKRLYSLYPYHCIDRPIESCTLAHPAWNGPQSRISRHNANK